MAITKTTIIKFIELIIACVLVGLHYNSYIGSLNVTMLTTGTFCGYLIIFAGMFIGVIIDSTLPKKIDLFFIIVGIILFIIVGALNIDMFSDYFDSSFRNRGLAKGVIALVEAIVLIVDAFFAFKGGE